jgi:L-amino acid N-acyltransferase YncA
MIRPVCLADADGIARIYNHYVLDTTVTFEETPVSPETMAARIAETIASLPWLVCEADGRVIGYAYASPWKSRCAYRYAAEASVYLDGSAIGRGLGTELLTALIAELRGRGTHTIIGGVALPNPASVALQEKLGFQKVAHFKEVGWKLGKWIDVGYWELVL